jgi:alkanesulfonate monooxygenase SsuD/methylene tetrahydromethanopterin reductase-like flavin-dependent oxidoreductase (luciferase family)
MNYGLALPTGGECGDPRFLVELAERAEAAGWDGIFPEDYVLYQGDPTMPTSPTWPVLAAIAVRTERLVLGVEVTPLARRRPWNVAREVAAVDQLSEGRAVLGVGLGDVGEFVVADASFTHFGEELDARRRAEQLDEGLEIIAGLWTGEPFSFRGTHYTVDEVTFLPRAVSEPRAPDLDRRRLPTSPADRARTPLGRRLSLQRAARSAAAGGRRRPSSARRRAAVDDRRRRQRAPRRLGR